MLIKYRKRRMVFVLFLISALFYFVINSDYSYNVYDYQASNIAHGQVLAITTLDELTVKGRALNSEYDRSEFGNGWQVDDGCDTRNIILNRDLNNVGVGEDCTVLHGTFIDPYTGNQINFKRGQSSSSEVQIDHVVALSDAWQKGAQNLSYEDRIRFANDPLVLLAVSGDANQKKSGSDAASWLPSNKSFRCQYVARQIAIKIKYQLWITQAEKTTMRNILNRCPNEPLPNP